MEGLDVPLLVFYPLFKALTMEEAWLIEEPRAGLIPPMCEVFSFFFPLGVLVLELEPPPDTPDDTSLASFLE